MGATEKRDELPKTVEEAVKTIIAEFPLKDRVELASMKEEDLIKLHFSLGMSIRNRFGLWAGNEELLKSCASLAGVKSIHPDDASAIIITELWKKLRDTHTLRAIK